MSKYTTEVRYICETEAGLQESAGGNDVDSIIANSRTKIFNFNYPIYDENYKGILETKILKHFYTREIGLETVGLWKLKLNTKMNEIMPYYNQLYKSALLEFNPLWTDDYSTLHNRKIDGINEKNEFSTSSANSSETNSGTITNDETAINSTTDKETLDQSKNNNNISSVNKNEDGVTVDSNLTTQDNTSRDKYSDTPQGALTDLEADKYLTNARKITEDNKTKGESTRVNNGKTDEERVDLNEEKLTGNNQKTSDSSNVKSSNNTIDTEKTNSNSTDNNSMGVNTFNNVEDYLEYVQGRRGRDASELLLKYRKTFLNIDMQVIDDLEELFLHLW